MSEAIIRPIEKKDKEEWIELYSGENSFLVSCKVVIPKGFSKETVESTFERFFDPAIPVYCFVAVNPADDKLIGFATYLTHYNTWSIKLSTYMNDLFVKEGCRMHGTGRLLINAVYDWADKNNSSKVYWHTGFHNHRAQMLYTKIAKKEFISYRKPKENEKPDYYS